MSCRPTIALTATMLAVALFLPPAYAQMRGGHFGAARAPRTGAPYTPGGRSGLGFRGGRGFYNYPGNWFYPGWAYWPLPYPDYGYDYGYDNGYGPQAAEAPPAWLMPAPPASLAAPARTVEPLVVERQGDQWVRIGGYSQAPPSAQPTASSPAQAPTPTSETAERSSAAQPAPKLPPAVLVFRDGHQEEIRKYTIIGPTIYAQADYWRTGAWRRKVAIADLDIPATLKLNQERGGKFSLPSGPDEIVFRP